MHGHKVGEDLSRCEVCQEVNAVRERTWYTVVSLVDALRHALDCDSADMCGECVAARALADSIAPPPLPR